MSGAAIVRALLVANAAVTAEVATTRISAAVLPQGTDLPYLAIDEISRREEHPVAGTSLAKATYRVQVTVAAATYPAVKDLLALVQRALRRGFVGPVAGLGNVTCRLADTGPDARDSDGAFCFQTQDALVTCDEPA